ncbi:MAG TPA: methylated-DNA--[protein]-cysteine S-methyltransferase [Holophaga sp.]|nr:methylated-DNA--[protein]-cysteine S-methyltransferase [Holophaga sp.]HPS66287.1 methylated-DNA--[protein]-cysteine S-methyltransferase [Holophaga sp.]
MRAGPAPEEAPIVSALVQTPLGPMAAASVDQGLCLLEFTEPPRLQAQLRRMSARLRRPVAQGGHPHLDRLREELGAYFAGELRAFTVPLFTPGTPFQELVWRTLQGIRYGEVVSYEALAERIGRPAAFRAVGRANGMNPVSILVPCHRVVNKNGNLCGYGGGLWRKRALLDLERTGTWTPEPR